MAKRPVFIPTPDRPDLVLELMVELAWHPGFAISQKRKNIVALHESAAGAGYSPLLEVSTKSEEKVGQRLSAFNLKVRADWLGEVPLECAFQGSKVFERGGPFTDLYHEPDARTAKRDPRLQHSGKLVAFSFGSLTFPLEPKTSFYDWLYISAIYPHREWLHRLHRYAGFTDIEFNPERSINCQARSCALFVSLDKLSLLDEAVSSPSSFIHILSEHGYQRDAVAVSSQDQLFPW